MIDLRRDIDDELIKKGISCVEIETLDKLVESLENNLINNGYWDLIKETIDESGIKKEEFAIEIGEVYLLKNAEYLKKEIRNKKVKVVDKFEDGSILVEVLEGRFNGQQMNISLSQAFKKI
ncbi:hypothetical protein AAGG74_16765 [Bacillus mexicanus]|uniref:hypothetical protein n=1 Tax=Bacillus mexicanus TaxID=2834415 RepID=UPI003D190148